MVAVLPAAAKPAAGLPFRDRFPFGTWQSDDGPGRWHLDFNDHGCDWIERGPAGATLQRVVELQRTPSGWRIQRANDAAALTFLGASAAVAVEILQRNPLPSFIDLDVVDDVMQAQWNGLRWTLDGQGHVASLEQPGSTPATAEDFVLRRQGSDDEWFIVGKGQLTFDQEGQEGSRLFHSRWLQWPGGASGVTLGRGYDMGARTSADVRTDLMACGVSAAPAAAFAGGAGLRGAAAQDFVTQRRATCGNITPGQQLRLFKTIYQALEDDTRRICSKADVVAKYGAVDFARLDARIWTVVVDLRYRGDYTPAARGFLQKLVVANDLAKFRSVLADRPTWVNVPQSRFDARVRALA